MDKKRILWISDAVIPTGFGCVANNLIGNLDSDEFEIHHLGINYRGDPHPFPWMIYPASIGGDVWGFNRIRDFASQGFDGIFILNDVWVISTFLEKIKESFGSNIPPIVVYFPVDSKYLDKDWFKHFDIVSKVIVYTQFGYDEVKPFIDNDKLVIMPHGVDHSKFFKIPGGIKQAKKKIFPHKDDFQDSFVVLNANRNQPRKRVDLTIEGFAMFAEDKPKNVKLYLHMGIKDMGWDIVKMANRYNIDDRLILTNTSPSIQVEPIEKLNMIYNACDVGINTGLGEGFGLTSIEHAAVGGVQIVPDHSALPELYSDCGLIIPVSRWMTGADTLAVYGYVSQEDVANTLQTAYDMRDNKLKELSELTRKKFSSDTYRWSNIADSILVPIFREIYANNHNMAH